MLLNMAPQVKTILNVNTVNPTLVCRAPVQMYNGVPSDQHVFRLKCDKGLTNIACVLVYGKADDVYLRAPAIKNTGRAIRHRGLVTTAYRANLKRLSMFIAHVIGHRETFAFHYGGSHVALSQRPEPLASGELLPGDGYSSDSASESDSESKVTIGRYKDRKRNETKRQRFSQDPSDMDDFNFQFPVNMSFNEEGEHGILIFNCFDFT